MASTPAGFIHVPGPLQAHVCDFGQGQGSTFDGLLTFGGTTPDPLPADVRAALAGHIQAGRRVVVVTRSAAQMAWVKSQIAVLTAPGGRA